MTARAHRWPALLGLATGAVLLGASVIGGVAGFGTEPVPAGTLPSSVVAPTSTATETTATETTATKTTDTGTPAPRTSTPETVRRGPGGLTLAVDESFTPAGVRVSGIDVEAPVVPTGVDRKGGLVIPEDPREVGWWSGGAAPGAPYGTILLAGHVDSAEAGLGSLVDLGATPVGATVTVTGAGTGDSAASYRVVARRSYPKTSLRWPELLRQDVEARLLLVTCGGEFDRRTGHYERNVVVFAVPA
jgi:hypothetical protein